MPSIDLSSHVSASKSFCNTSMTPIMLLLISNNSSSTNVIDGKKNKKLDSLEILKGGRGKSAKKKQGI